MPKRISNRLKSFDSSVFRNLFIQQQSLSNPIDLSVGIPEDNTHEKIKKAGVNAILEDFTSYAPSNGLSQLRTDLRKKLSRENNITLPSNQITVVPGLTTGLLLVYMAILDAGDEIITIDPGYPPYEQLARAMGAKVISVPTLPSFQLDLNSIKTSINNKTKAIVINTPNNPTGAVYPEKELRKLAEIAKAKGLLIISDEIYEHFVYEEKHFSIGSIYSDTISMHGFSKQYSMTGWRLGYISGPADILNAINELQQYSVFSSSSIAQHAAIEALNLKINLVDRYRIKRDLVTKGLHDAGVYINGAQGSYYVFFKTPKGISDLKFAKELLDHNLILVPGRAFTSMPGYMRLSYGAPIDTVKQGVDELSKVIRNMLK